MSIALAEQIAASYVHRETRCLSPTRTPFLVIAKKKKKKIMTNILRRHFLLNLKNNYYKCRVKMANSHFPHNVANSKGPSFQREW